MATAQFNIIYVVCILFVLDNVELDQGWANFVLKDHMVKI